MSKKEKIFPLNTFGGRMQDLRKNRLNISRPEFYDLIFPNGNVATESKSRTVKNWESGDCEPDIKTIKKICIVLKCSSDYLLGLDSCTTKDTQFIHDKTGLSEKAIDELHYLAVLDSALAAEPDLNTINSLLEQLSSRYDNIIHTITDYLRSNGLSKDTWYNIRNETLSENKPPMDTDRLHIPAHSDIFDNLLLMDIQKRIINLKTELKKAPDTN